MHHITADQANLIVRENLKHNKKRTFNESGIHFDGDVWAFPINNKIFIGMADFAMDEKTRLLVQRAMFRHAISEKLKNNNHVVAVGGLFLLSMLLFSVKTCKSEHVESKENKQTCVLTKTTRPYLFSKFIQNRSK